MKIYIAGPYAGDTEKNVEAACVAADAVSRLGHYPFVPHLTMYWHRPPLRSHDFWLLQDLEWLRICDAVLRIGGKSPGADAEVAEAIKLGIPVYYSLADINKMWPMNDEYADKLLLFRAWLDALRNGITTQDCPDFIALKQWLTDNFSPDKIRLFSK